MRHVFLLAPFLLLTAPAYAQELRDFCGDRPGLGTPACTVDRGHIQIEAGVAGWTHDRQPDTLTDTILAGDVLARYGLTDTLEARLGWTTFGHVRERDRSTGDVARASRSGDVTVGLKQSLANPDGDGFSLALLPFVSLPVGRMPVGAGDWGAALVVPVTYALGDRIQLEFTPEVDAAMDESGHGRHLAYGTVLGVSDHLSEAVTVTVEYQVTRDRDPAERTTQHLAGVSLAWLAGQRFQIDVGTNLALNHAAPDVELYFGISRKF